MKSFLFLIQASVLLHLVSCQNVTITKSFEGDYVCPGENITFTCTTNGSVVAWISNEYIGINGIQLEFSSTYPVGHRETSMINYINTFANLTMKDSEGDRVIESKLHITVSQDIPSANITCSDVSRELSSSVQFELPSLPSIPQDVTAFEITPPPGDNCIILVNWIPPNNTNTSLIKQYKLDSPAGNFTTKEPRTEIAVALLAHHCENGSNARIKIHAIDSCGRDGASSDDSIVIVTELLGGLDDQQKENRHAGAIVGGVLGGFIGFTMVILIIALGIALYMYQKSNKTLKEKINELKKQEEVSPGNSTVSPGSSSNPNDAAAQPKQVEEALNISTDTESSDSLNDAPDSEMGFELNVHPRIESDSNSEPLASASSLSRIRKSLSLSPRNIRLIQSNYGSPQVSLNLLENVDSDHESHL